jgi:hypothetical protein
MSLNTDTVLLRKQVLSFLKDIQEGKDKDFEKCYKYLFELSKGLFDMVNVDVRNEIKNRKFDSVKFNLRLDQMIYLLDNIKSGNMTQYDASSVLGNVLAKEYINVCK